MSANLGRGGHVAASPRVSTDVLLPVFFLKREQRWNFSATGVYSRLMKALFFILFVVTLTPVCHAARAPIDPIANDPYTGAIVVDVATGKVLFEDGADARVYPASVVKLMDLLLILERVENGALSLATEVYVNAEAASMGGSQVYLKEGERFSLDEMLFALCIKSANDVAVALATQVAGSKRGFVELMNRRAAELGMAATDFQSVHGLPPETGQKPDVTTARDIASLALAVIKQPKAIGYTSTQEKWFRDDSFQMLSHNRLLGSVPGCDGLKTGYYRAAGFSIAATAIRDGRRIVAVVMGCSSRQVRDSKARELLELGFTNAPAIANPIRPAAAPTPDDAVSGSEQTVAMPASAQPSKPSFLRTVLGVFQRIIVILLVVAAAGGVLLLVLYSINRYRDRWKYRL